MSCSAGFYVRSCGFFNAARDHASLHAATDARIRKAGRPEKTAHGGLSACLLPLVLLDHRLDLLLDRIQVETGRVLHWWIVDGRFREINATFWTTWKRQNSRA
jgi:hypothetical protein